MSIDLSLANIWQSWYLFRKGKRSCRELETFCYYLERNLFDLCRDLNNGDYQHDGYREFTVYDNKKRKISVASVRDRVVHRLVYEYLVEIYDKTFIYDVWSCRINKGLLGAIKRSYKFLTKFPDSFIWRADIKKFFDNVDQQILKNILLRRVSCPNVQCILDKIIDSYNTGLVSERERERVKEACRLATLLARFLPIFT